MAKLEQLQLRKLGIEVTPQARDTLDNVDWTSELLASLLSRVDQSLPHPSEIMQNKPGGDDVKTFWMDPNVIFTEVFKKQAEDGQNGGGQNSGENGQPEKSVGMDVLSNLLADLRLKRSE